MDFTHIKNAGAVALEDCIMVKGTPVTAGSKILEGFTAPFGAAAAERLENAGAAIWGKTGMPEFSVVNVVQGEDGIAPSVKAVLEDSASACLCNDLFGLYRRQAAENNLVYIHPTYGTVSRYGLIPAASSMDQIGVLAKDVATGFSLLSAIAGHDSRDGAMYPETSYSYKSLDRDVRLCVPENILKLSDSGFRSSAEELSDSAFRSSAEELSRCFALTDEPLPLFDVYKQVMYILACAEISNNINRYDGVKFGYRSASSESLESLYTNTRTEGFGIQVKLAAVMGAFVLSADQYVPYYEKAMKIRGIIRSSLQFDKYDVIALPVSISGGAYDNLSLYALSALAGLPCLSFSYKGRGIQLIGGVKGEGALLKAWEVMHS